MNIETRREFKDLLDALLDNNVLAVDSETNGLSVFGGNRPISLSFWFPATNQSFNFAWAHGQGEIEVPAENRNVSKFHDWKWTGKGKKQAYKKYWWEKYQQSLNMQANITLNGHVENHFGNVPFGWMEELREVWNSHVAEFSRVVYFNSPFDIHMMRSIGFNQPKEAEDVYLAVNLVFEDWRHPSIGGNNSLKWQANYHKIEGALEGERALAIAAGEQTTALAEFIAANWDDPINASFHALKRPARVDEIAKKVQINSKSEMWMLPAGAVAPYAENDTRITWALREKLLGVLDKWHQRDLYFDLCEAQNSFAIRMETNGVLLDKDRAEELVDELAPVTAEINAWFEQQILNHWDDLTASEQAALTGKNGRLKFTCGSSQKLPIALSLLTGYQWEAADKQAMLRYEENVGHHEAIDKLKRYRFAQRAVNTYLRNWIKSQDENGFIHFAFNTTGAKTGRWSSSSGTLGKTGNGQNIPTRGFRVKEAIVTPPDYFMVQIDYGQIELRLAAWIAGCEPMIAMFNSGEDMHQHTSITIGIREILFPSMNDGEVIDLLRERGKLKKEPETEKEAADAITDFCRAVAKVLNFGLLYTGTWRMVRRLLRIEEWQARELHKRWNDLYPEFAAANKQWTEEALLRRPRPDGSGAVCYVLQPISGRARRFAGYPITEKLFNKKTGKWFVMETRARQAKDAFNFAVQGLANYIMWQSQIKACRLYGNDQYWVWAVIHDSINFYVHKDSLHILKAISEMMTDWDVNPRLTADVEVSKTGTWQGLKKVNLDKFIESGGKEGWGK